MIRSLDKNVGKIVAALERNGRLDDTIIFFTSDNGGLATSEGSPTCTSPVTSPDYYPTILEMIGAPPVLQQHVDGRSFVPALKGDAGFDRGPIYWHYPH